MAPRPAEVPRFMAAIYTAKVPGTFVDDAEPSRELERAVAAGGVSFPCDQRPGGA